MEREGKDWRETRTLRTSDEGSASRLKNWKSISGRQGCDTWVGERKPRRAALVRTGIWERLATGGFVHSSHELTFSAFPISAVGESGMRRRRDFFLKKLSVFGIFLFCPLLPFLLPSSPPSPLSPPPSSLSCNLKNRCPGFLFTSSQ